MAAYGESIAEGGALGLSAVANRSCQRTREAGLHSPDGSLGAETCLQAQREPSRCHRRVCIVRGEMSMDASNCAGSLDVEAQENMEHFRAKNVWDVRERPEKGTWNDAWERRRGKWCARCEVVAAMSDTDGTCIFAISVPLQFFLTHLEQVHVKSADTEASQSREADSKAGTVGTSPCRGSLTTTCTYPFLHLVTSLTTTHATMASSALRLRPLLLRQLEQLSTKRAYSALTPAIRQRQQQPAQWTSTSRWAVQRAAFQTSAARCILPPQPQVIHGSVNDPVKVPESHPSHGSYHWTAERYAASECVIRAHLRVG